jgi:hypothetical protein
MYQYIAADVDKNGKIDLEDINILLKYLTGEIQNFSNSDWLVTSTSSLKPNMKITELINWLAIDKVEKDLEKLDFMSIQLGNIVSEPYAGNIIDSEWEAEVRSLISSQEEDLQVEISPNPFVYTFEIKIHTRQKSNALIELYDLSGKMVQMKEVQLKTGENYFDIEGRDLNNGMYIYKVKLAEKQITGKVIKQS